MNLHSRIPGIQEFQTLWHTYKVSLISCPLSPATQPMYLEHGQNRRTDQSSNAWTSALYYICIKNSFCPESALSFLHLAEFCISFKALLKCFPLWGVLPSNKSFSLSVLINHPLCSYGQGWHMFQRFTLHHNYLCMYKPLLIFRETTFCYSSLCQILS